MEVNVFGIDLAKEKNQVCGCLSSGKVVWNRKYSSSQLKLFLSNHPKSKIFLEACSGSHRLARELTAIGHEVKLIAPQFVKPFVKTNKSDAADAEAIVTAGMNPNMRFVPIKTQEHLDLQMLHRIRERLVCNRTALVNEIRSALYEYGIKFPQGVSQTEKILKEVIINPVSFGISIFCLPQFIDLQEELAALSKRIEEYNEKLESIAKTNEDCTRILAVPGVGVLTATAIVAAAADPSIFRNGREFSAWLGLVPKHTGTGGKTSILGVSKRGNSYIRRLLISGAMVCVTRSKRTDSSVEWAQKIKDRSCTKKAAVALANKNGRIIWSILVKKEKYRMSA